jgi:hypothetical protein
VGLIGTKVSEEPAVPILIVDQTKCYHIIYDIAVWNIAFLVQLIVAASGTMIFRKFGNY